MTSNSSTKYHEISFNAIIGKFTKRPISYHLAYMNIIHGDNSYSTCCTKSYETKVKLQLISIARDNAFKELTLQCKILSKLLHLKV